MKKLVILFMALLPLFMDAVAQSASAVIDRTVANLQNAPSISAKFDMSSGNGSTSGIIELSGSRFVIASGKNFSENLIWYDGRTMWAYSAATNEVTITEPEDAELAEINPLELLKSVRTDYTAKMFKSGNDSFIIDLKAKKTENINNAQITVDAPTYFIKNIVLTVNKQKISISLSSMKKGKVLPDSYFRFNKTRFPKAEINDLR